MTLTNSYEEADIIFEDDIAVAVHANSAIGHVRVYPKKKVSKIWELSDDDVEHLFIVASYAATMVFEGLGYKGTNILVDPMNEFYIDVLPRNVEDGFDLKWGDKRIEDKEMDDTAERIKEKCEEIGSTPEEVKPIEEKAEEVEEESIFAKHLERIP